MQEETWKDIPNYEGLYQVSDRGRVRGYDRIVSVQGRRSYLRKGAIKKLSMDKKGYLHCCLTLNGIQRNYVVHQLVAYTFFNHRPQGHTLVVDHINNVKTDNRLENLQIVTNRYNVSKDSKGTSKYPGVHWHSKNKKWVALIVINRKQTYLGSFTDEGEAGLAYQRALIEYNISNK